MAVAHVNGTDLFYTEVGDGIPILVMHGGLGVDHTQFREWLDPLGDVFRLVYYDHRCNGRSARPPIDSLTFDQLVADANALRAALGFDEIAVMGHSYGGCLALLYALQYPQHVGHLLLVGTTAAWDYFDEMAAEAQRRALSAETLSGLVNLPTSNQEMARYQRAIAPVAFHRENVGLVDRVLGNTIWNWEANVRSRKMAGEFNVVPRLGEISAPTLILTGRDDFFCPPAQAERMHRGIHGSTAVIFERSGHYPFAEENAAFQDAVRAWLRHVT